MELGRRTTVALVLAFVVVLAAGGLGVATFAQGPKGGSSARSTGLYGQTYSCGLTGGEQWKNNSFPFQKYAINSTILHLQAVSSWLASNGYSISELRPYGGLYPTCGNPYDFADGAVGFGNNGTTYLVYEYIVTNSPDGLVIGAWVAPGSTTVGKIFTYVVGPGGLNYGGPGLTVG